MMLPLMVELVYKNESYAIIKAKAGTQLYFYPSRKELSMRNKSQCFYTIGRVISEPAAHVNKDTYYLTSYVELFGGMKVSALAGKQKYEKGSYVGVRITPKGNGEATYHAFELNEDACNMIRDVASYIGSDDEDLLPF